MKNNPLISIGEISKICHISKKTLRHYEKIGLIAPAFVNPVNQYRYYHPSQIMILIHIRTLKINHYTLDEIKDFIKDRSINRVLQNYSVQHKKITQEISDLMDIQGKLANQIASIQEAQKFYLEPSSQFKIKEICSRDILWLRNKIPNNLSGYAELSVKLQNLAMIEKPQLYLTPIVILHTASVTEKTEEVDITMALPLKKTLQSDKKCYSVIQGGLYASFYHNALYPNLEILKQFHEWLSHQGYTTDGPPIELVLIGMLEAPEYKQMVCEYQIKIKSI